MGFWVNSKDFLILRVLKQDLLDLMGVGFFVLLFLVVGDIIGF